MIGSFVFFFFAGVTAFGAFHAIYVFINPPARSTRRARQDALWCELKPPATALIVGALGMGATVFFST